jgi:hypothetical protein
MPPYSTYNCGHVSSAAIASGCPWYKDRPNIVGIRHPDTNSNGFNDVITLSSLRDDGQWAYYAFVATTDPGVGPRKNPSNPKGVGTMAPGYYKDLWTIGKHKSQYDALVQVGPVKVFRDNNKDNKLDLVNAPTEVGVFGGNLHRSNELHQSVLVDGWSEMCQVLSDPADFVLLMTVCQRAFDKGFKKFDYTLLEQKDLPH